MKGNTMEIYQNEVMQVAGFIVQVNDEYDNGTWSYGMFDTYDEALAFTSGLPYSAVEPIYKPVKH
jgi:hypothetical protein